MESVRRAEDLERATRKSLSQVQAELDQATSRLKHTSSQYERQQQDHRKDLHQLQCKLQDAEALAGERAMQLSVITDTVEALQAGTASEQDQCVVTLTTQLVASKGRQAGDEKRCRQAEALAKDLQDSCSVLELKNDQLEARCRHTEAETASLKHQLVELKEELQASCTQLRDLESLKLKRRDEADRSFAARDEAESKAAGLQQALQDTTNRHLEEQLSARADAQRSRKHDLSSYLSAMPPPSYIKGLREQMSTLIEEIEQLTDGTSMLVSSLPPTLSLLTEYRCIVAFCLVAAECTSIFHFVADNSNLLLWLFLTSDFLQRANGKQKCSSPSRTWSWRQTSTGRVQSQMRVLR